MASRESFTIGWVCALQEEYEAACAMLDEEIEGPEYQEPGDSNTYCFGRIGGHRIVIGSLPSGRYGVTAAARVMVDMTRTFYKLRLVLMVGIAGGAPTSEQDIRLGDVVVSVPYKNIGGVVQFDMGKLIDGTFQRTGHLNSPPSQILNILPEIKRRHQFPDQYGGVDEHLKRFDNDPRFHRPSVDRLFRSDSKHQGGKTCTGCDPGELVARPPRTSPRAIDVFYGTIASSNTLMKDARARDSYAHDPELKVLCFEMEAAGLMNDSPCLVIRGICDYCDLHKNDEWHYYAAATAAAYARELLSVIEV